MRPFVKNAPRSHIKKIVGRVKRQRGRTLPLQRRGASALAVDGTLHSLLDSGGMGSVPHREAL